MSEPTLEPVSATSAPKTSLRLHRPEWQRRLRAPWLALAERLRRGVPAQLVEMRDTLVQSPFWHEDDDLPYRTFEERARDERRLLFARAIERLLVVARLLPEAPLPNDPSMSTLDDWPLVAALEADLGAGAEPVRLDARHGVRPAAEVLVRAVDEEVGGGRGTRARVLAQRLLADPATGLLTTRAGAPLIAARQSFVHLIDKRGWWRLPPPLLRAVGGDGVSLATRLIEDRQRLGERSGPGIPASVLKHTEALAIPDAQGCPAIAALPQRREVVLQLLSRSDVLDAKAEDGRTIVAWLAERWRSDEERGRWREESWWTRQDQEEHETLLDCAGLALRIRRGGATATSAIRALQQVAGRTPEAEAIAQRVLEHTLQGLGADCVLQPAALAILATSTSRELRLLAMRHAGRTRRAGTASPSPTEGAGRGRAPVAGTPPRPRRPRR